MTAATLRGVTSLADKVKIREGLETRLALGEHLGDAQGKGLWPLKSGHWLPRLPLSPSAM